jgi:hypothetical protein
MELSWLCGGKEVAVKVPDRNVMKVISPKNIPPIEDVKGAVRHALENPIGSKRLSELVKPNSRVTLIANNAHSPGGFDRWVGLVIDELHKGGVKDDNINFIMASGVHKAAPQKVMEELLGKVTERYEVTSNQRDQKFVFKGITPTAATPVWLNEKCADADLTIGLGALSFNNCGGYGGGVKTLCPGVVSYDTICTNHRLGVSPLCTPGNPENPMRRDIEEMAGMANYKFMINTALDNNREILHVVAGDPVKGHREGVKKTWEFHHFDLPEQADILIGNCNAPWPGMGSAVIMSHLALRKGGTMILTQKVEWPEHPALHRGCQWWAECDDSFRKTRPDTDAVLLDIHQGRLPAWVGATVGFQVANVKGSGWKVSRSLDEALRQAFDKHGRDAKVVIVPNPGRAAHLSLKK